MNMLTKGRFAKLIVIFLAVGLLLEPVHGISASEATVTESSPIQESSTPESVSTTPSSEAVPEETPADLSEPESESGSEKNTEDPKEESTQEIKDESKEAETSESQGIEPPVEPTIQLPPTTVKQKLPDADIASGALVYSYSLRAPSGRNGTEPGLSLNYNSQQNEEGSLFGYGWGLSIPTIERKNVDGLNKIFSNDNFVSSLDGDLRKISTTSGIKYFGAKIDNGSYLKYEFDPTANNDGGVWNVYDKEGNTLTFGATANSRLSSPDDSSKVFRWHLTKLQDSNGNFVSYEYVKESNQVYPSAVYYTGFGTDPGIFNIEFELEDRPDQAMSAKYGFMITNIKRIAGIKLLAQSIVVGEYRLEYEQQPVNRRSQLASIEYTGYDSSGANGTSDGEIKFEYQSIAATDLLTKIIQNTGGTITITYKPSTQYRSSVGEAPNPNLPFSIQTVQKIEYNDKNGVVWDNTFEYEGGWFYFNGPFDRRFVGFERVTRIDDVGNKLVSYYHQGNDNNFAYGEVGDDWAKAGKLYKTELRDVSGNIFTQVLNRWDYDRLAGSNAPDERSFTKLVVSVIRTFDGNTSHKDRASEYTYDEDTGNLTSSIDWGEVNAIDTGLFTDIGNDKVTISIDYAEPNTNLNITGLVSRFIERNQSEVKVKEHRTHYDSLAFGQVSIGKPTKEEQWVQGSQYSTINRTYNSHGLMLTETDPRNNTTTYSYDSVALHPVSVINALGQVTSYQYDYRIGQPFKITDPNNMVSKFTFDGLGRIVKEEYTRPNQSDSNLLFVKKAFEYELYLANNQVSGWKTLETNYLDNYDTVAPRENKQITYTDGFGRSIQTRQLVEPANGSTDQRFRVIDTVYNNIAQVGKTSLPYFSIGADRTSPSGATALYTELTYDPASRVVMTTNSVGTITTDYEDWEITITDPNGKIKNLEKDAFERLVQVTEHNGSDEYDTEYFYDTNGNVIKIVDALGNERNFTYDGLNRRTSAEDLHSPSDSSYGTWTYEYDLAGNLISWTTAAGQVIEQSFDALNRLTVENYLGSQDIDKVYAYDSCVNGVGRVCRVTGKDVSTEYQYDVLGQMITTQIEITGENYITTYSYDRQGNQLVVTNPDGSQVRNLYDLGNQLIAVATKESGDTDFSGVIERISYHANGQPQLIEYVGGSTVENTYSETQQYRLTRKLGTVVENQVSQVIQDISYGYDAVGNILTISDSATTNPHSTVYAYDDLHRLTSAQVTRPQDSYTQTFEYDAIGNMTYNSKLGTYYYEGDTLAGNFANPHAVTRIVDSQNTETQFSYDQNGNILTSGEYWQYQWTYDNRLSVAMEAGVIQKEFSYLYDYTGSRVSSIYGKDQTVYISDLYNQKVDGLATKHVFANDNPVATIIGSGTQVTKQQLYSDHLGSITVAIGFDGVIKERTGYAPFGALDYNLLSSQAESEQRKYTGHEYDVDTGLLYAQARYYNPSIGRFLSQDPAFWQLSGDRLAIMLSDPQIQNSYSYARNNPLAYIDETGEFPILSQMFSNFSQAGYAGEQFFRNGYNGASWSNPAAKISTYLLADVSRQAGVVFDANAPAKDRVTEGVLLGLNGIPGGSGGKILSKADDIAKPAMTADDWAKVAFDAQKQQADRLKGVTNPSLRDAIKNLYRPKDSVPGGTAGAIHYTKQTGIPIGGSNHIVKGEGRLTQLQRITTNVVGQQLNRAKTEAKKLWRALTR